MKSGEADRSTKKQLTGIGEGIELIPLLDDIPKDFWVPAGLGCGVFGLITAARSSGE